MLHVTTDESGQVVILEPDSALSEADFEAAARTVDPLIDKGTLKGLAISTEEFPSWDSFGALVGHLKFVKNHQEHLKRVAIVTDSRFGDVAEKMANHFVVADIKHFPNGDLDAAKDWISSA